MLKTINMPSRIAKMSRRRRKIAVFRMLTGDLMGLVGKPDSPYVRAAVTRIVEKQLCVEATIEVQPRMACERIAVNMIVGASIREAIQKANDEPHYAPLVRNVTKAMSKILGREVSVEVDADSERMTTSFVVSQQELDHGIQLHEL